MNLTDTDSGIFRAAALSLCLAAAACTAAPQPSPTPAAEQAAAPRNLIVFYDAQTGSAPPQPSPTPAAEQAAAPRNLIVFYDAQTGSAPLRRAAQAYGAKIIYEYKTMNGLALAVPDGADMAQAEAHFSQVPGVLGVNRDQVMRLH